MLRFLLLVFIAGCGLFDKVEPNPKDPEIIVLPDMVKLKVSQYKQLIGERNASRNDHDYGCDSLLFESLAFVAGVPMEVDRYREGNKWYRRPTKDCWPNHSGSTISRDMFTGLGAALLHNLRIDLLKGVIKYAEDNNFIMGEGEISRTHFSHNMLALYGRMLAHLGYPNKYQYYTPIFFKDVDGYEAHLQILQIIVYDKIYGRISGNMMQAVKHHYKRNPRNVLFSLVFHKYTDKDYREAGRVLMDEALFPNDRLPTDEDRCGFYLWQYDLYQKDHTREKNYQWRPCNRRRTHDGYDFIFAANLYLEYAR